MNGKNTEKSDTLSFLYQKRQRENHVRSELIFCGTLTLIDILQILKRSSPDVRIRPVVVHLSPVFSPVFSGIRPSIF